MTANASPSDDVFARLDREQGRYLEELKDYLRIPSISTDPAYRAGGRPLRRLADRPACRRPASPTEKIATAGHPLVYAEWTGRRPGEPTVLFYGHYDVQPPDPLDEWRNPPFEPTDRGRLTRRAAAPPTTRGSRTPTSRRVEAMLAERGRLPVNVKFLVEGEEEVGGEAIETYVRADAGEKLACDCVVISDTSMCAPGIPAITYGLKGLAYFEIRVQGPNRDLHSGVYGGGVTNPANALAEILAALRDSRDRRDPASPASTTTCGRSPTGSARSSPRSASTRARCRADLGVDALDRRGGLHLRRAHLGAADLRRQRPVERLPGQGRQDRAAGQGRLQGLVPPGRRPDPGEDRRAGPGPRRARRAARRHGRGRVPARRRSR